MAGVVLTSDPAQLDGVLALCRQGRVFAVAEWIDAGKPAQLDPSVPPRSRQHRSPLRIAIEAGNHSLVEVLLGRGYDPRLETTSPIDWALRVRRKDFVEMLLAAGADPKRVVIDWLLDSYETELFERFYALGLDFTQRNAVARALAYSTRNRPLYGFVKRHHEHDAGIARQLQVALNTAVHEVECDVTSASLPTK